MVQMSLSKSSILVTEGTDFFGAHVVRRFVNNYPDTRVVNLDALTYAGNLENLRDIKTKPNYVFEKVNILDTEALDKIFTNYQPTGVVYLAAESHVYRSIDSPLDFVYTTPTRRFC